MYKVLNRRNAHKLLASYYTQHSIYLHRRRFDKTLLVFVEMFTHLKNFYNCVMLVGITR